MLFTPHPTLVKSTSRTYYLICLLSLLQIITLSHYRKFNCPDIDWDALSCSSSTSTMICNFAFDLNLEQLVSAPIHIKGNILDIVLTNCDNYINNLTIHPHQGLSIQTDHFILSFSIAKSRPSTNLISPRYVYDYSKADWDGLSSYLLDYNFDSIFHFNDVETCWMSLKQSLLTAMSLFVPKLKLRAHQRFTASIQNHLNKVHSLRKKARSTPSPQNLSNLASSESLLLVSTFSANKNYKIFNYMRYLTTHNSLPATIRSDSSEASSNMEKANLFNQYFYSVFTRSNYSLPSLQDFPVNGVSISEITSQRVMYMKSLLPLTLTKLWVLMVLALMFLSTVLFHYVVLLITSSLSVFVFTLSLLNGIYTASSLFLNQGTNL